MLDKEELEQIKFYPGLPCMGEIYPLYSGALVLTQVNLQTKEGTFKLFDSVKGARLYMHDVSKSQVPDWHEEHCEFCKFGVLR